VLSHKENLTSKLQAVAEKSVREKNFIVDRRVTYEIHNWNFES
jgi:hypothetical protein